MNGAAIALEALAREGVSVIFGYPGAAIAPFYEELSKRDDIRHILVRNEQNAGHAASGYARASGKAGVCCTTSGPGATNLITALATAYMDSIALVAITGQVPTDILGHDAFQEADITGACESFTKYSYLCKDINELPRIIKEAFHIAQTGRPGPVLIDLPIDVQLAEAEPVFPQSVDITGYKPRTKGHPVQIKKAITAISEAEKPVICTGGGVVSAQARKELTALAEQLSIPVVSTLMGVGTMSIDHPLYMGMLGTHGCPAAKKVVSQADLLILCGARVGDRTIAGRGQIKSDAKIIHIDIDPVEIGKNMSAHIPIVGDIRLILRALLSESDPCSHTEWIKQTAQWKKDSLAEEQEYANHVNPRRFIRLLSQKVGKNKKAILTADVGQNQIWAANSFNFEGGRFLTSGGMGTMGYSIPAAMGAKLAKPSREVIAVCGDGSFQMMLPELATIMQHGIAIKIIVMKNGRLGMIRELQEKSFGHTTDCMELGSLPDISKLAEAYGIKTCKVKSDADSNEALDLMLKSRSPFIVICSVDENENSILAPVSEDK